MSQNPTSLMLIFTQALMLAYLFLSGPVLPENPLTAFLELLGIFVIIWSLWTMRSSTLQITADIAPESVLVTNGPYSYVRHPMYSGLLLVVLALLVNDFTWPRLIAIGVITLDLLLQIHYEEVLFLKHERHAKDYLHYQEETKKLIPFVY